LKKKNQKNFSPFGARRAKTPVIAIHPSRAPNTPYGLKLPSLAANRSQTEKSFFASFFSKKEDACLAFAQTAPTRDRKKCPDA
jgi:hypothetical protein